eukprot:gene11806-12881_t
MNKDIDINAEEDRSTYSGTFRWKSSKKLPNLPPLLTKQIDHIEEYISLEEGWKSYFLTRGELSQPYSQSPHSSLPSSSSSNEKLIQIALKDLCFVDCLSFPLSIAYTIIEKNILNLTFHNKNNNSLIKYESLNILCIGCSYKTEERILRETNCFQELQYLLLPYFQQLNIYLIGPEISETRENFDVIQKSFDSEMKSNTLEPHRLAFHLYKGTTSSFIKERRELLHQTSSTVIIGYNCGFGNFDNNYHQKPTEEAILLKYRLLLDWIYDLSVMTQLLQKVPSIFFCANEYSDVKGEIQILLHIFGMEIIAEPCENPFSMASTMVADHAGGEDYSRGNSFYYGFQGIDLKRRKRLQYLKEFHQYHVEQNVPLIKNPYAALLVKELLPYIYKIPDYSQALQYLKPGKLELTPVIIKSEEKQSSILQKELQLESKSDENKEVLSHSEAPKPEETKEVEVSTSKSVSEIAEIGLNHEDQVEDYTLTQERQDNSTEKILLLRITSDIVDLKSIDLGIHRNGKMLLLKYRLLSNPKEVKEQRIPLDVADESLDPSKAKIEARLLSKKKLLTIKICF